MTRIRVPDRIRIPALCSLVEGQARHGYGPAGDRLCAKLFASSGRSLLDLDADELAVAVDYAETLYDTAADDARWGDQDARNDRAAARRFLRNAGRHP